MSRERMGDLAVIAGAATGRRNSSLASNAAERARPGDGLEPATVVTPEGKSIALKPFVAWGGPSVEQLVKRAIGLFGTDLTGLRVLDVGYGHGHMSSLFALLGAEVFAVDTHDVSRQEAVAEAKRWGVSERIQFSLYSGDPGRIPQAGFDIAFTKSVLLLIPELEPFLRALSTRLRPNGQVAFVENGFHNPFSVLGRRLIHWWNDNQANDYPGVAMYSRHLPAYLTPARINIIRKVFDVRHVVRAQSPHWYLIHGFKT